jgi:carboxyl-terminal processing protease
MKNYNKNAGVALIVAILLMGSFFIGKSVGLEVSQRSAINAPGILNADLGKPEQVDFATFWRVWDILNDKFVPSTTTDAITDQEKVYGAIEGLAASLNDPYTAFLPPVENEIFEADVRGNFEGVGMEISVRDGVLTVISPIKGSPAYEAGVLPGDKIVKIGDKSTYNMTTEESVTLIRGKKGTAVVFTVIREGTDQPIEISVIRDVIDIPTINTEKRADGVFLIELYSFSANSPNLFRLALREFIDAKSDKLLLDLRGNPGGYLEAAIDMASWFLPGGKIVVQEDFGNDEPEKVYRSSGYDIFNSKLKMVILVDGGSASASEILAGALKEHGIAKLVGDTTFGKGSVQELIPITSDTSLKVTIARWLTPNGVSISDAGIEPDVKVELTSEDVVDGKDLQKDKALELLLNWPK